MHHLTMGEKSEWRHTHVCTHTESQPAKVVLSENRHGTGMILNTEVNNQGEGAFSPFLAQQT